MTTWAIGDLQGCYEPTQRLLEKIRFDPARDRFYERDMFEKMHDDLHNALLEVERRRDDVARYWLRVSSRVGSTGKVLKMWNSGTIA